MKKWLAIFTMVALLSPPVIALGRQEVTLPVVTPIPPVVTPALDQITPWTIRTNCFAEDESLPHAGGTSRGTFDNETRHTVVRSSARDCNDVTVTLVFVDGEIRVTVDQIAPAPETRIAP